MDVDSNPCAGEWSKGGYLSGQILIANDVMLELDSYIPAPDPAPDRTE